MHGDAGGRGWSVSPRAVHLERLGATAAESLRKTVKGALTALLDGFVQRMPAALAELEANATDPLQRQAARELRSRFAALAGSWVDTFMYQVDARLVGSGAGTAPTAFASDETDDAPVLRGAELRAEDRYRDLLSELDTRIDAIRQTLYVPLHVRALAPAGLVRALQDTANLLGWPQTQSQFLFARFEDWVVPKLGAFYRALALALKTIGNAVVQTAAAAPDAGAPAKKLAPAEPQVDAGTVAMLQAYAVRAHSVLYDDSALAADLLTLLEERPLPDLVPEQRHVPLQRMSLAGQFINEAIADPLVTEELRQRQDAMRMPVVKIALADTTLFTSPVHPIGTLINDLMLKSATARITGSPEERRAAERLEQVLVQFDLAPEFVREAMLTQQPIDEMQVQWFMESKRTQAAARRQALINTVRRRVVYELELSSFGRQLAPPLHSFLQKFWGPMLMKRLLDHGADDPRWTQALDLMDQLIAQVDKHDEGRAALAQWQDLLRAISESLAAAGMKSDRIAEGLAALQAVRRAA